MGLTRYIPGNPDCKYDFEEKYNAYHQLYENYFKINCPSEPDREFDFKISMESWEWTSLMYEYFK